MTSIADAIAIMERAQRMQSSRGLRLVVRKFNPGALTAHQTTDVKSLYAGIDWDAGKLIIEPAAPLTELTPEQVADITKSVRAGSSWHAYKRDERMRERIKALEAEVRRLGGAP